MELSKKNSNLHYLQAGKGDPLVFLHGFPDCAVNYKDQIEFFSANGFEVFVPLMPGYHEDDQELDTYQSLKIAEELSTFINSVIICFTIKLKSFFKFYGKCQTKNENLS